MKMFNLIGIGEKAGSGFDVMRGCSSQEPPRRNWKCSTIRGVCSATLYPRKIAGDSMIAGAAVPGSLQVAGAV